MTKVGLTSRWGPRGAWVLFACVGTVACAPEMPKSKAPSATASTTIEEDAKATTDEAQVAPYIYSPVGKRDPFRDPSTLRAAPRPAGEGQIGPLQKFDLDQLKLQFTTTATSSPLAMVIDPGGIGHIVQIGDFIGKNWGKVSAIRREEITVMETIADPNTGRVYPQYIPLRMKKSSSDERAESTFSLKLSAEAGNQ